MNRQRFLDRNIELEGSGDPTVQNLATALAQTCDAEFLEAVLHMKAALDEFGGQVFIAAARGHFDEDDQIVPVSQPGRWTTYGYLFHYGDKPQIRRLATDEEAEIPEPPVEADEEQPADLEPVGV